MISWLCISVRFYFLEFFHEFLGLDFFMFILVSDDCKSCPDVLQGLEKIDQETDNLDITFIKINDPRYARKYGVTKLPALVYFRKKFPSIYRGIQSINFTLLKPN